MYSLLNYVTFRDYILCHGPPHRSRNCSRSYTRSYTRYRINNNSRVYTNTNFQSLTTIKFDPVFAWQQPAIVNSLRRRYSTAFCQLILNRNNFHTTQNTNGQSNGVPVRGIISTAINGVHGNPIIKCMHVRKIEPFAYERRILQKYCVY